MSKLLQVRHWAGCVSLITPRRGGTEHAYFRAGILWPAPVAGYAGDSRSEALGLLKKYNIRTDRGYFEAANPALGWSIKTALPAGITGTVLAKINGQCVVNPTQWSVSAATLTGAATDKLDWLVIFNRVLTQEQIFVICDTKTWTLPVSAGSINITTAGFRNLRWTFPDGSTSTDAAINRTVGAGTVSCRYVGIDGFGVLQNNISTALNGATLRVADLPRVTYNLQLYYANWAFGKTSDIPRVRNNLFLYVCSNVTGPVSELPLNGGVKTVAVCPGVFGALPVVGTNRNINYSRCGASAQEYDQTVQNIVDAGATGGLLYIGAGTPAGDANLQILRDRGWTINIV